MFFVVAVVAVFNFARAHDFQSNLKHITSLLRLGYQSGFHFGLNYSTLIDNKKEILIPENTKLSIQLIIQLLLTFRIFTFAKKEHVINLLRQRDETN